MYSADDACDFSRTQIVLKISLRFVLFCILNTKPINTEILTIN